VVRPKQSASPTVPVVRLRINPKKLEEFVLCVLAFSSRPECGTLEDLGGRRTKFARRILTSPVIKQSKAAC